jgi:hypothetical protein
MSALAIPPLFLIGCCILAMAIETLGRDPDSKVKEY